MIRAKNLQSTLEQLNLLSASGAESELLKCCGCKKWAQRLLAERPFESLDELSEKAARIWWSLEPADWLEAFHSHPKIGEQKAVAATAREAQQWSADEQSGMRDTSQTIVAELAQLNRVYEEKFGFIFIVCASGKSSAEMLGLLQARLENDRSEELRIAAAEQAKITQLRLRKLIDHPAP